METANSNSQHLDSFNLAEHYLWQLRRFLTRFDFEPDEVWVSPLLLGRSNRLFSRIWKHTFGRIASASIFGLHSGFFMRRVKYDRAKRLNGQDWPLAAETMVGLKRLENVDQCIRTVLDEKIPGDFLEAGVWRGGTAIYMTAALRVHGDSDRKVILADSFRGLPKPDGRFSADFDDIHWSYNFLSVSADEVTKNFEKYGIPTTNVEFLKGFFKDSLPSLKSHSLSILRLDGDMYGSTIDVLENAWEKLSPGGFLIVDDWSLQARQAVEDFLGPLLQKIEIRSIDSSSVYFRKP